MISLLSQGPIFLLCLAFMLGIVVVIHELGHYLAGRFFGAAIESFSVGFGGSLFERTDSRGTRWRVNWIPLGGFVKFVGEHQTPDDIGEDGEIPRAPIGKEYYEVGVGARTLILLAGPVANFILAIGLFAVIFGFNGIYESRFVVSSVTEGQPAAEAGMEPGDVFVAIEGNPIETQVDISMAVVYSTGVPLTMTMDRRGDLVDLIVTPERVVRDNEIGQKIPQGTIGIQFGRMQDATTHHQLNPVEAVGQGIVQTGEVLSTTTRMLGRIVTGKEPLGLLTGPVGIGDAGRRVVNRTMERTEVPLTDRLLALLWQMLGICAAVSVGIGFFNLLPLPILDGGHIVFNAYEAVTGSLMPERVQEMALRAGIVVLLTLFVFITWGDILETGLFNGSAG
ncbi:MAG: M50 family metallopeptidase [Henriciella sp.]|nr:M50 family metallopeptidase [Henriciella sp.]